MNYDVTMTGTHFETFDQVVKLLVYSANESDYKVKCFSYAPDNFKSSWRLKIRLTGSLKEEISPLLVDFDRMVLDVPADDSYISPDVIGVACDASAFHYWSVLGFLISKIQDVSPAYVTGYLLENKMENELAVFRQYLS